MWCCKVEGTVILTLGAMCVCGTDYPIGTCTVVANVQIPKKQRFLTAVIPTSSELVCLLRTNVRAQVPDSSTLRNCG